jgi:hypothetical protein
MANEIKLVWDSVADCNNRMLAEKHNNLSEIF